MKQEPSIEELYNIGKVLSTVNFYEVKKIKKVRVPVELIEECILQLPRDSEPLVDKLRALLK